MLWAIYGLAFAALGFMCWVPVHNKTVSLPAWLGAVLSLLAIAFLALAAM